MSDVIVAALITFAGEVLGATLAVLLGTVMSQGEGKKMKPTSNNLMVGIAVWIALGAGIVIGLIAASVFFRRSVPESVIIVPTQNSDTTLPVTQWVAPSTPTTVPTSIPVAQTGCPSGITIYLNVANGSPFGQSTILYQSSLYLSSPYFGNVSAVVVPSDCRAVLHDAADSNRALWLGSTLSLSPGTYDLTRIVRDPVQTPWNTRNACTSGLMTCWNDSTVAIEILGSS